MRIRTFHRSFHAILVISFVLCGMAVVSAQPELDITFNGTGKATVDMTPFDELGRSVLVQADNKVVVVGATRRGFNIDDHFGLTRFNADGSLDTTFGDQGKVITIFDANGIYEGAYAAALQPDGKIVVAGFVSILMPGPGYFAVARYNTDGSLDTSFSNDGKASYAPIQHISEIRAMAVAPNGSIVVAGRYFDGQAWQTAVVSFNSDESGGLFFDVRNFGGWQLNDTNVPTCIAIQPDGKIIVGLTYYIFNGGNSDVNAKLIRLNPNGTYDFTFVGGGSVILPSPGVYESITALSILPNGHILAAGNNSGSFLLMRFNENGGTDHSFGSDGRVITPMDGNSGATALAVRPGGKIISSGLTSGNFGVAVYNADGSLDTSFSGDGKLIFGGAYSAGHNMGFDSLGRIVLGGSINGMFAAARLYTLEPTPVSIYGRTLSPSGQPIVGISVGLTDRFGVTRWTLTSPFGYYQFDGVMSGQTVTLSVSSKRYLFDPKDVGVNENLADVDLVGVSTQNRAVEVKPDRAIKGK